MATKDAQVAAVTAELERLIDEAKANIATLMAILDPDRAGTGPPVTEGAL